MAKQHYCFLERFNNYFNRKVIRYESLSDYQDKALNDYIPVDSEGNMTPFDFNPNDNITTEIIANSVPFDADYFLLLDDDGEIVSRWFVLEQKRNRQGQWLYFLRRDVLADSINDLLNAPLYVEKGIISDLESPLLLNNEGLLVNQIKKEEILLKDRTDCAWFVIYLKKGALGNTSIGTGGKITVDVPDRKDYYKEINTPIHSWQYADYENNDYQFVERIDFRTHFWWVTNNEAEIYKIDNYGNSSLSRTTTTRGNLSAAVIDKQRLDNAYSPVVNTMKTQAISAFSYKTTNPLIEYDGMTIKDSDGKYWQIHVYSNGNGYRTDDVTSITSPALKSTMTNAWRTAATQPTVNPDDKAFQSRAFYTNYRLEITPRDDIATTLDLGAYTGEGTTDSPLFDAICLPYGEIRFWGQGGLIDVTSNAERSLMVANSLCRALTELWVLDFQLLPYCPVQTLISDEYQHRISIRYANDSCVFGSHDGDYSDVLLVCENANFSFDIAKDIYITDNSDVPSVYKRKYINDCTLLRLCSPNYNGLFEMNLAKNGGRIHSFNVDMTLKPFNPYIHVNPDFNFLYGQDFNDVRGLVCGGDFSLGIINDAWNVYEIQNKNYQAIFDRQIQNMDVNNAINMQEAVWGAVAGTVQGTASGAITGGITTGSPYGAIAGAAIGGVASGLGGAMDIQNLQKRQFEAKSYAIDNYNYSLGNIKALPYSITKTSALTYNNKLFPFIEIYECSEVEKEAYYLKLKYNGMTVSKIDTIQPYRSFENANYFRAKLIRADAISEDNHYVETINEELMKGVFI